MDEDKPATCAPEAVLLPPLRGRRVDAGLLTTGEMAQRSRSTVRTVRFYEESGVLEPAARSEGGHRLFAASELDKLLFVTDLRAAGLSLDEIKEMLAAKASAPTGAEAAARVTALLSAHLLAMREKVVLLSRLHDDFAQATGALGACRDCHDDPNFPASCGACRAMAGPPMPPRAVRVLWNVASPSTLTAADD